jgi:hypothetical protein
MDRDMYRSMMRERLGRKKVSVREKGVTHWLGQAQKHPSVRFLNDSFPGFDFAVSTFAHVYALLTCLLLIVSVSVTHLAFRSRQPFFFSWNKPRPPINFIVSQKRGLHSSECLYKIQSRLLMAHFG